MSKRVLMIEDDEDLAAMVGEYLGSRGFEVTTRFDAVTGMKALRASSFDVLILDVMLPDVDGFEVCRRVRAESDVPIVMLTARGEEMDRIIGLELGADDYLSKPFSPRELLARLNAIVRRGAGRLSRAAVLRFGRLEIDPNARTVTLGDHARNLTSYQFDVLYVLAVNAGRVMSRTEARQRFSVEDHAQATAGIECRKDAGVIDETPMAYKSIDAVMEAQRDLVDIVHTLRQVVCVKG